MKDIHHGSRHLSAVRDSLKQNPGLMIRRPNCDILLSNGRVRKGHVSWLEMTEIKEGIGEGRRGEFSWVVISRTWQQDKNWPSPFAALWTQTWNFVERIGDIDSLDNLRFLIERTEGGGRGGGEEETQEERRTGQSWGEGRSGKEERKGKMRWMNWMWVKVLKREYWICVWRKEDRLVGEYHDRNARIWGRTEMVNWKEFFLWSWWMIMGSLARAANLSFSPLCV